MHYTITRGSVSQHASELLRTHLRLRDFSPTCTARVVLSVWFCACSRLCTLSAACFGLLSAPSRETIRKATLRLLPTRDELLRRLNRALTADVPRALRRRDQQVAIDLVLIPYHGRPMLDLTEVYRSQAKSGTSHFHAYATAHVHYRGQRYTLALTLVERGEKMQGPGQPVPGPPPQGAEPAAVAGVVAHVVGHAPGVQRLGGQGRPAAGPRARGGGQAPA